MPFLTVSGSQCVRSKIVDKTARESKMVVAFFVVDAIESGTKDGTVNAVETLRTKERCYFIHQSCSFCKLLKRLGFLHFYIVSFILYYDNPVINSKFLYF